MNFFAQIPRPGLKKWQDFKYFLPKNYKMFPLKTWKVQAIFRLKLQAVVITISLVNFLEKYLIVKRTLTTVIFLRCTWNVHAQVRFFSRCIHKMCSYKEGLGYIRSGAPLWTKNIYISLYNDLPKKINVRPQSVWSHWTLSPSSWNFKTHPRSDNCSFTDHWNINKILNVEVLALICGQKKSQSLWSKIFPKIGFKATIVFSQNLIVSRR